MKHLRLDDLPSAQAKLGESRHVVPRAWLGNWVNTNNTTRGIVRVVLATPNGHLVMRAFGAGFPSPCDWGEARAYPFASDVCSTEVYGISAFYDFGFMETSLQMHEKQGVLVVAKWDRFKDGSGRSNRFSRDFFHRVDS